MAKASIASSKVNPAERERGNGLESKLVHLQDRPHEGVDQKTDSEAQDERKGRGQEVE